MFQHEGGREMTVVSTLLVIQCGHRLVDREQGAQDFGADEMNPAVEPRQGCPD